MHILIKEDCVCKLIPSISSNIAKVLKKLLPLKINLSKIMPLTILLYGGTSAQANWWLLDTEKQGWKKVGCGDQGLEILTVNHSSAERRHDCL